MGKDNALISLNFLKSVLSKLALPLTSSKEGELSHDKILKAINVIEESIKHKEKKEDEK